MDCLDDILDFYKQIDLKKSEEIKIQTAKILIELMKDFDNPKKNYLKIKNCLLLLINLFFDIDVIDHYQSQGKSLEQLNDTESKELCELLKSEFNNFNFNNLNF